MSMTSSADPRSPFWTKPAFHLLLIALVGLAAYSNSFQVPFILDDEGSITANHVIKNLESFLSGAGYSYNPRRFVGYLTVALNYRFGALDVTDYHVVNLVIHVLAAWLVYALARLTLQTPFFRAEGTVDYPGTKETKETKETEVTEVTEATEATEIAEQAGVGSQPYPGVLPKPAVAAFIPLCAALFFIAHPVQTQAVTYIIQRLASLATMFFLLSIVCYAWARLTQEREGKLFSAKIILLNLLALAAAGCAMKTKEISFTLPFVIVLYEFFFFKMTARKKLMFLLPVALTVLIVPLSLIGTDQPLGELLSDITEKTRVDSNIPRLHYLFTQFPVIVTYLRLIFLPVNQNLDYDFPVYRSFLNAPVLLSFLLLAALFGLALFLSYRSREGAARRAENPQVARLLRLIAFGLLWFFITISVESSVIPIVDVIFEHRLYLPSAGLFIALAAVMALLLRNARPQLTASLAAAAVLILTGTTFARNAVWGSELTLWTDVVQHSPNKARPHYNLALALNKLDRIDEAWDHAEIAARITPEEANPHNLIGSILGRKGMYDQAIDALTEAVRLAPELADAHINLGDAYRLKGLTKQAMEQYLIALKLTPTDADIYNKMGATYSVEKNMEKAVVFYQCAASLNPSRPEYRFNLERAQLACPPAAQ